MNIRLTTQDGLAWLQFDDFAFEADRRSLALWLRTAADWLDKEKRFGPSTDFSLDAQVVTADPLTDHGGDE